MTPRPFKSFLLLDASFYNELGGRPDNEKREMLSHLSAINSFGEGEQDKRGKQDLGRLQNYLIESEFKKVDFKGLFGDTLLETGIGASRYSITSREDSHGRVLTLAYYLQSYPPFHMSVLTSNAEVDNYLNHKVISDVENVKIFAGKDAYYLISRYYREIPRPPRPTC